MVVIVDNIFNIVWVGYLFCAFKASFNYYQKPLDNHHIYYIKINLTYHMIFYRDIINFIYRVILRIRHLQILYLPEHLSYIYDIAYLTTINIIYNHQSFIYIFYMIYMDTVNIDYHIQPVIYTDNLLFIDVDSIFYMHQPLLYSALFEYVNIVWHCGGL